jgi:MarR family transcriptional regulator, 2-MHQ and catechol-resistance regulon repressor
VLEASKNGCNKMSRVSRIMLVPGANITSIAKRLEKAGFILKKPDPSDERVTLLEITPKGRRALKNIEKEKDASLASVLKNLTERQKRDLLDKLKRILINGIQNLKSS